MKRLLFLLFFPAIVLAQDCDYQTNEVDKFTKEKVVITKSELLKSGMFFGVSVKASEIDGKLLFTFPLMTNDIVSFKEGDEILFLDKDEKVYTFRIIQDEIAEGSVTSMGTFWKSEVSTVFEGDPSSLEDIVVSDVRMETGDSYIEKEIKSKRGDAISKVFNCIRSARTE